MTGSPSSPMLADSRCETPRLLSKPGLQTWRTPDMSDEQAAVDATMEPWTIKSCARRTRLKVVRLAQLEGITVGVWLERRVDEWEADGSPAPVRTNGHVHNPVQALATMLQATGMQPQHLPREVRALINDLARQARGKQTPSIPTRASLVPIAPKDAHGRRALPGLEQ
jgi:hypothetical protein